MRSSNGRETLWRSAVLLLTFMAYTAYHMSRKPISVVKNAKEFLDCSADRYGRTFFQCFAVPDPFFGRIRTSGTGFWKV
jgi:hypothetical protein